MIMFVFGNKLTVGDIFFPHVSCYVSEALTLQLEWEQWMRLKNEKDSKIAIWAGHTWMVDVIYHLIYAAASIKTSLAPSLITLPHLTSAIPLLPTSLTSAACLPDSRNAKQFWYLPVYD